MKFFEYNISESAFVAEQNLESTNQSTKVSNVQSDVYPKNDRSNTIDKGSAESVDVSLNLNRLLTYFSLITWIKTCLINRDPAKGKP